MLTNVLIRLITDFLVNRKVGFYYYYFYPLDKSGPLLFTLGPHNHTRIQFLLIRLNYGPYRIVRRFSFKNKGIKLACPVIQIDQNQTKLDSDTRIETDGGPLVFRYNRLELSFEVASDVVMGNQIGPKVSFRNCFQWPCAVIFLSQIGDKITIYAAGHKFGRNSRGTDLVFLGYQQLL